MCQFVLSATQHAGDQKQHEGLPSRLLKQSETDEPQNLESRMIDSCSGVAVQLPCLNTLVCFTLLPAGASLAVTINAISGTTPEGDALVADGPYGMWSLDAEQVRTERQCGCQ